MVRREMGRLAVMESGGWTSLYDPQRAEMLSCSPSPISNEGPMIPPAARFWLLSYRIHWAFTSL